MDLARLRSRIGMVFQKPTPFPMSVYDNVAFGVRLYENLSKSEMDDRVEESLRRAALWDEVKDKLHASGLGLSGGARSTWASQHLEDLRIHDIDGSAGRVVGHLIEDVGELQVVFLPRDVPDVRRAHDVVHCQ